MRLRYYPDPVLRVRTEEVRVFDQALADLAKDMVCLMHESNGLGLAAPQVGVSMRMAIVASEPQPGREVVMVNPQVVASEGWEDADEGCLSFPGIYVKVGRFRLVTVRYQDLEGRPQELQAEGILARAVQHELDHLDGRLLVDRMSPLQRVTHRRRLRELRDRFSRSADADAGVEVSRG